ncbi:MAG TPA: SDR family oxidoreductase [Rugosimonospora sp.]|nr:SDR family oxidoreductase [Rugosimonospora sp.]
MTPSGQVLVVGAASGMGAAVVRAARAAGARVVALDHAPIVEEVDRAVSVDLRDPASIDRALATVDGPVAAVYSAAGVADGPDLMRVNVIGHRYLVERLLAEQRLPRGSAVCFVSSVAGIGWESDLTRLRDFLATVDYAAADAWVAAHEGTNNYAFSKQAINAYVATRAMPMLRQGVRLNAICPGPTDTPLARGNADLWLAFGAQYRAEVGCAVHTAEEMADVMVFLNSRAARGISGVTLLVDNAHVASSLTGVWMADKPLIDLLSGRG